MDRVARRHGQFGVVGHAAARTAAHVVIAGDDEEDHQTLEHDDERAGDLHRALHFVRTHQQRAEEEGRGNRAQRMELLMVAADSPAKSSAMIHLYRAYDLTRVGPGGGDDSESIDVHEVPLDSLLPWLETQRSAGKLVDTRVYSVLALLR